MPFPLSLSLRPKKIGGKKSYQQNGDVNLKNEMPFNFLEKEQKAVTFSIVQQVLAHVNYLFTPIT